MPLQRRQGSFTLPEPLHVGHSFPSDRPVPLQVGHLTDMTPAPKQDPQRSLPVPLHRLHAVQPWPPHLGHDMVEEIRPDPSHALHGVVCSTLPEPPQTLHGIHSSGTSDAPNTVIMHSPTSIVIMGFSLLTFGTD